MAGTEILWREPDHVGISSISPPSLTLFSMLRHTHIIFQRFGILTHKTQAYMKVYGLSRRISFMIGTLMTPRGANTTTVGINQHDAAVPIIWVI